MDGTYRMLAEAHEADLAREAARFRLARVAGRDTARRPPPWRGTARALARLASVWIHVVPKVRSTSVPAGRKM